MFFGWRIKLSNLFDQGTNDVFDGAGWFFFLMFLIFFEEKVCLIWLFCVTKFLGICPATRINQFSDITSIFLYLIMKWLEFFYQSWKHCLSTSRRHTWNFPVSVNVAGYYCSTLTTTVILHVLLELNKHCEYSMRKYMLLHLRTGYFT